MLYLVSSSCWPTSNAIDEFAELPVDFVSMLRCLILEQPQHPSSNVMAVAGSGSGAAAWTVSAAQQSNSPASLHSLRPYEDFKCLLLSDALDRILFEVQHSDSRRVFQMLATPAVIELYKHILLKQVPKAVRHELFSEDNITLVLSNLMALAHDFKETSAQYFSTQSFLETLAGSGAQHRPYLRPCVQPTDAKLVRLLLRQASADEIASTRRCGLVVHLMSSWQRFTPDHDLMPPSSEQEQSKCVYLALHHCSVQMIGWMQRQQQRKGLTSTPIRKTALAPLATGVQRLVTAVYAVSSVAQRLADLERVPGECRVR